MLIAWILLAVAVVFEVAAIVCMKLSHGFTQKLPSIGIFIFYGIALALLTLITKYMNISIAYAIWAGAGTALSAVAGVVIFKEKSSKQLVVGVGTVILGIVLIKLSGVA